MLGVGDTAPGRKGAGISESMLSSSSSPNAIEASEASSSHDKIEPRACLPPRSSGGRRDDEDDSWSGGRGDKYDKLARVGRRLARVGVWGGRRFLLRGACILGIAGVGAPNAATGARRSSTSSVSLSSLVPSDMWDMLPALGVGLGVVFLEFFRECRASGDSLVGCGDGLSRDDFSWAARRMPEGFLALDVLGV